MRMLGLEEIFSSHDESVGSTSLDDSAREPCRAGACIEGVHDDERGDSGAPRDKAAP